VHQAHKTDVLHNTDGLRKTDVSHNTDVSAALHMHQAHKTTKQR